MCWFLKKEDCHRCNTVKTKRMFENLPTCRDCEIQILMIREGIRLCPVDGTKMEKENHDDTIIDRCPVCRGVWLDAEELEALAEKNRNVTGFATGLAIGIAIG